MSRSGNLMTYDEVVQACKEEEEEMETIEMERRSMPPPPRESTNGESTLYAESASGNVLSIFPLDPRCKGIHIHPSLLYDKKTLAVLDKEMRQLFIKVREERERLSLHNKQGGDVKSGKKKKKSS